MSGLHYSFKDFINILTERELIDNLNILILSLFLWIGLFLLVFKMFGNIPEEIDKLEGGANLLDMYLFKSLRIMEGTLFSPTALSI